MGGLRTTLLRGTALALWLVPLSASARHRPDEVMVRFRPGTSAEAVAADVGGTPGRRIDRWGIRLVTLPPGRSVEQALDRLRRNPNVELAEPNLLYHRKSLPNDPLLGWQWSLDRIGATLAWGLTVAGARGTSEVLIAVIDDGIDSTHPDLAAKIAAGYDPVLDLPSGDPDPPPFNEHGTFVASIAAAVTDDGTGMAGAAWNARLLAVKISGSTGTTWAASEFDILKGVDWAVARGARVLNLSLGSCWDDGFGNIECEPGSQIAAAAVRDLWMKGVVVVAAAGNESTTMPSYPAAYPFVLGAAATDWLDRPTTFSNRGVNVDVAAPGGSTTFILCDPNHDMLGCTNETTVASGGSPSGYCPALGFCPGNCHATGVGTSEACPLVAAVAAVLIGQDPVRSAAEVAGLIRSTAEFLPPATGWTAEAGYGRLNLYRALTFTPPPPAAHLFIDQPPGPPPCPPSGTVVTVRLVVRNDGSGPATEVSPRADPVAGSLQLVTGPAWTGTEWVAPGGALEYLWTWRILAPGEARLRLTAEGMDVATGGALRAEREAVLCDRPAPAASDRPYAAPNPVTGDAFTLVVPLAAPAAFVRVEAWNAGMKQVWHGEWKQLPAGPAALPVTGVAGWAPGRYLLRATVTGADGPSVVLDPVKVVVKR